MNRDPSLIADQSQQLEVALGERAGQTAAVGVEDADDALVSRHRRTHHRADLLLDDAFPFLVPGVGRRVPTQGRCGVFQHVLHDRPADAQFIQVYVVRLRARRDDRQLVRSAAPVLQ